MVWNVSLCSRGDTGSVVRFMISSCERVFLGFWGVGWGMGRDEDIDFGCGWGFIF